MKGFNILKSGILTLIQDPGRAGVSHLGISQSGYLDEYAARWANKLLDNNKRCSMLEILFGQVSLEARSRTTLAITGANCEFFINDEVKDIWQSYIIQEGDIVRIGKITEGNRVYVTVKNGFDALFEFGSSSTSVKEGFGPSKIKKNDFLAINSSSNILEKRVRKDLIPNYTQALNLRVVLGYQHQYFKKKEKEKFFSQNFTVTSDFNRMACKLSGKTIHCDIEGIISEGISFGAIQVPKNGQIIILLKERQTIGGYPKIGSVLGIDCFKLSQAKVGTSLHFKPITINDAQEKTKQFYKQFK